MTITTATIARDILVKAAAAAAPCFGIDNPTQAQLDATAVAIMQVIAGGQC